MIHRLSISLLLILSFAVSARAQLPFSEGDWVSYVDFRHIAALDGGSRYLFAASSGGVLIYEINRRRWENPQAVGYSITETIPLTGAVALIYDEDTNYLWVCTHREILRYDVGARRWIREARDLWLPNDRVVNMGLSEDKVIIEVIPGQVYAGLFPFGNPLPQPSWQAYVRRFSGSRLFGSFFPDHSDINIEEVHWRGLRSKIPLSSAQLYGWIGSGPANFPHLKLPNGSIFLPEGEVQDRFLRTFPITDWFVDRRGMLWFGTWGGGIGKGDIRSLFAEMFEFGPAGNDIRALLVQKKDIWLGGDNEAPLLGITRCSRNRQTWQHYEPRAEREILSTIVYDFETAGDRTWIATEEGLLSFKKKKQWRRFGLEDGLWSNRIRALAANDTQLWVGTDRGLNLLTLPGMTIWRQENTSLRHLGILRLRLHGDTLYIGTPNGLFRGSIVDRVFEHIPLDPGLLTAPIRDISVVGKEVWTATRQGVQVYNSASGESRSWLSITYLRGEEPTCLLATKQAVWVGTDKGIWRWWRERNEWIDYRPRDGLIDAQVEVIRRDGDYLLIGTANGLTRFYWNDPKRLK